MEELEGDYEIEFVSGKTTRENLDERRVEYSDGLVLLYAKDGCVYNLAHIARMSKIIPDPDAPVVVTTP